MSRKHLHRLLSFTALTWTSFFLGCAQAPQDEFVKSGLSPEEAMALASTKVDYEALIYNNFLPPADFQHPDVNSLPSEQIPLKVGISWVLNDQFSPWVLGKAKGFFSAEGIDLQLIEGGPGRDNLVTLIGDQIDIFVGAAEPMLQLLMSPTGADLVVFAASMKGSSAGWVMLDDSVPQDQRSSKKLSADDIIGKRVGIQGGSSFYTQFVCDRLGISPADFTIVTAGATPEALISGAMDFYQCWIVNQPRILERSGFKNWVAVTFNELGYVSYNDMSVVKRETFEQKKDIYAAYTRALARSMDYIVANPEASAKIVSENLDPVYELSPADVLWRMEREVPIYKGDGSEPMLYIDPERIKDLVALLIEYGQVEL